MYKCQDCGFKGKKTNAQGGCAACESFNIKKLGKAADKTVSEEKEKKTAAEIFVLIVVWSALAYGVWERYLQ